MSLNLKSSGGGSVTVDVPSTSSNYTATLPAGTGNVVVNGINGVLVSGTSVTASGTSVDFTSIPSWVKRITVTITAVGFAAAGTARLQIGSGSLVTTGYTSATTTFTTTPANTVLAVSDGLSGFNTGTAATNVTGQVVLTLLSGNTWVATGSLIRNGDSASVISQGRVALSGVLDRLSLVATTSTFDEGSINILYE